MRLRKFIHQTLVRDADMLDRAIEVAGFGIGLGAPFFNWGDFSTWSLGERLLVSIAIISATVALVFCRHAYRLANNAEPKIELRFAPTQKFITDATYQTIGQLPNMKIRHAITGVARYIRVEAINRSKRTACNCSAYLLAVKKVGPDGELLDTEFDETMRLNWSIVDEGTINMDSEIHYLFNILFVVDSKDVIQFAFADAYPLRFNNLCSEPGKYRVRVCVRGIDVQSETLAIDVNWTGKMESTTAQISRWRAVNTSA